MTFVVVLLTSATSTFHKQSHPYDPKLADRELKHRVKHEAHASFQHL